MAHESLSSFNSEISTINDPKFVRIDEKLRCCFCHNVLSKPIQAECGHRACEGCVPKIFANGSPTQCPASDKEEPCEPIHKENFFPDASARREIGNLKVFCQNEETGCKTQVSWKDLDKHLQKCSYRPSECPNRKYGCQKTLPAKDVEGHVQAACQYRQVTCRQCRHPYSLIDEKKHHDEVCQETLINCPFKCGAGPMRRKNLSEHDRMCPQKPLECQFKSAGCQFMGTLADVKEHTRTNLQDHLELVTVYTGRMELQNVEIQTQLQQITQERNSLNEKLSTRNTEIDNYKAKVATLENILKDLRIKHVGLTERVIKLERKLEELPRKELIEQQSRDLQVVKQKTEELQAQIVGTDSEQALSRYGGLSTMADAFTTQMATHDRQIGIHDVRIAEMDLRFQILETASYDGVLLWKIRDYTRRKQEAVSGRTLSLYSQPFYTSKYGYKMCARIYLNGDGMGKTTHVSLFFVIMRGEYDSLIAWPFGQKVTLYLLDQGADRRHLSDHFHPDPSSNSFRKPQTEMNVASGCPLFVSHSVLENPANNYMKDDTIFIKIAVETANLRTV